MLVVGTMTIICGLRALVAHTLVFQRSKSVAVHCTCELVGMLAAGM